MKKILFSLVALVCSMSMNAQVMKVMKGNVVVATYTADQADNVVFEEAQGSTTTGTAKATIGSSEVDVNWVQLWADGPKFAEYNVGVTDGRAESYGGYYCWGKSTDQEPNGNYKDGSDALTNTDDTAYDLWGSAWRMPRKDELEALCNESNCTITWKTVNGVNGREFTGKGDYASNSVFLPAAGYCYYGDVHDQGYDGFYWSSTPDGSNYASYLLFNSGCQDVFDGDRYYGFSVRAVLAE